jgi:hypothetical protein
MNDEFGRTSLEVVRAYTRIRCICRMKLRQTEKKVMLYSEIRTKNRLNKK